MMNNKSLKSGNEYTLVDIFSGIYKIIIPDLQRDYCWGGKIYDKGDKVDELVTDFVTSLVDLFKMDRNNTFTLGLIYGYEQPEFHIQLCDGQQRITTLFLLLGVLNRKTEGKFQKHLISNLELDKGNKEPYLQYAIRESTLYFLSDLVCEFFLEKDLDLAIDKIEEQDWFFDEYRLDPSITSMLSALKLIDERLQKEADFDFYKFGDFILNNLQLLYYDLNSREQGEETFVVINTTGEPLTATENLKPIFINSLPINKQESASRLWEEWETFFWKNRKGSGKKGNDTADKGLLEFFRWLVLLNTQEDDEFKQIIREGKVNIDKLKVEDIEHYYGIVEFLFNESFSAYKDWLAPDDKNDQIDWFRLLPVIEYVKRFGRDNYRNILRVKRFFENMARHENVGKDIANMLPLAIRIIQELPSADIASIIDVENVSKTLLTEEEELKFKLYKQTENREELENTFWKEEDHKVWAGEIMPLLKWSGGGINFNFDLFKKYSAVFSILFHDTMDYEELDITRRALLTRNLLDYPKIFRGNMNYSFCWEYSEWKILINDNDDEFKLFFNELLGKDEQAIYQTMESMIENCSAKSYYNHDFLKNKKLLAFCEKKNTQWNYNYGWILLSGNKRSGSYANLKSYLLYLNLEENYHLNESYWFFEFYKKGITAIDFKSKIGNILIRVFLSELGNMSDNTPDKFTLLLLFSEGGDDENIKGKEKFKSVAESYKLEWITNKEDKLYRYQSNPLEEKEMIALIKDVIQTIEAEFPFES